MIIIVVIFGSIGCGIWAIARHGNRAADRRTSLVQSRFCPLSGVGRRLSLLLVVTGGLSAVAVLLRLTELYMLREADSVTGGDLPVLGALLQGLALFYFLALVPTVVLFISWFHRAYANLDPSERRWRPKWAVRGWFVPLANLVIPFEIANDISRSSGRQADRPLHARATIAGWWFSWLGSGVLSWVGSLLHVSGRTVDGARIASLVLLLSEVLVVWAAGLAWTFVTSVTEAQDRRSAPDVQEGPRRSELQLGDLIPHRLGRP